MYTLTVGKADRVVLRCVVDQQMSKSVQHDKVGPQEYIDKPQSHLALLRLEENYEVELNGKYVKGGKGVSLDITRLLAATES